MSVPTETEVLATFPGDQLLLALTIYEYANINATVPGKEFDQASRENVIKGLARLQILTVPPPKRVTYRGQGGSGPSVVEPSKPSVNPIKGRALSRIKERLAAGTLEGYERWLG